MRPAGATQAEKLEAEAKIHQSNSILIKELNWTCVILAGRVPLHDELMAGCYPDYKKGYSYCSHCCRSFPPAIYIRSAGKMKTRLCACCRCQLRHTPHDKKLKAKYQEK
jgi:hypothetical protein